MIESLRKNEIIKDNVANLLLEIFTMLNKTVHSDISKVELSDLKLIADKESTPVIHLEIISKNSEAHWMINFDN